MSSRLEENFLCPICQDIFKDPVFLSCSHNFCKACVQRWWRGRKTQQCPSCRRRSSTADPPCNIVLRNLCEEYFLEKDKDQRGSEDSQAFCSLHSEKLKLFCMDHQQPVCVVCRDSRAHNNHRFRPISEAAQDQREKLQKALKPLQEKLDVFEHIKGNCDQTVKHIKTQAQRTEKQIREQFKKFHQFLQDEEEARIAALREEEEQKSQMMKEKILPLSRQIAALSHTIRTAEKEMRAGDVPFLQNYKAAVRAAQEHPHLDDPQMNSGALIDVAKHLGNLTFNIWSKMKRLVSYIPVILDPNTADPELDVSEDLSYVRSGERQQVPRNPERTKFSCSVLGSEGFNSGIHEWDVDVGNNKDWELGVLGEYIQMNGRLKSGLWRILFTNSKLTVFCTSGQEKDLPVRTKVQRIRVHLDYDQGKLSFFDLDTNMDIHTFTHSFSDTLFPYIYTENRLPLKILPMRISVTMENQMYVL